MVNMVVVMVMLLVVGGNFGVGINLWFLCEYLVLVLLMVVMVVMMVMKVTTSSVYLSCDQMGSVTEVGRVHSIWQLCHLQRTEFKRWPKFDLR